MKRFAKIFIIAVASVSLFGCGNANSVESGKEDIVNSSIETEVSIQDADNVQPEEQSEEQIDQNAVTDMENYTVGSLDITDVSETEKQIYFYRDDLKIFGKLYLPEGDGPFPVIVMQPGFRGSQTICSLLKGKFLENGIACLTYDCIGATSPSRSDGLITDMTFMTEIMDTYVVFESISSIPQLDADNVFVYGHSVGGLVVTYAATHTTNNIKGIIAVEPSYQMKDEFDYFFPEGKEIPASINEPLFGGRQMAIDAKALNPYDKMEEYNNKVLIFAGGKAPSIGAEAMEYLEKAVDLFPNAELIRIEEADHSFSGDAQEEMLNKAVSFIKENS